eukprot:2875426-Amphidinium_carterae.1
MLQQGSLLVLRCLIVWCVVSPCLLLTSCVREGDDWVECAFDYSSPSKILSGLSPYVYTRAWLRPVESVVLVLGYLMLAGVVRVAAASTSHTSSNSAQAVAGSSVLRLQGLLEDRITSIIDFLDDGGKQVSKLLADNCQTSALRGL